MDKKTRNIELTYLKEEDYVELKHLMIDAYPFLPTPYWKEAQYQTLLDIFPEGQLAVRLNGEVAGCALSLLIDSKDVDLGHTYAQITGNGTFNTHNDGGDTLYGIDVFVSSARRGSGYGRRLYDFRKQLCKHMNLKAIMFGGRMPNYHKYAEKIGAQAYINKVQAQELEDPVVNFQLSNEFKPVGILNGYMPGDPGSNEHAVLMQWINDDFQPSFMRLQQDLAARTGMPL